MQGDMLLIRAMCRAQRDADCGEKLLCMFWNFPY
jgi:hypothetical protein